MKAGATTACRTGLAVALACAPMRIRQAVADDHPAFARLYPDLATGDPTPTFERWRDELAESSVVAEDDGGAVVAYGYAQALRTTGYVRQVVVAPEARGRGLGRALLEDVARRLEAAGCTTWRLNVVPDNDPARRLYRGLGMVDRHATWVLRFPWSIVATLPGAEGVRASPVEPAEDALVEAATGLVAGQLGDARRLGGRVLIAARDAGGVVGAAVFDPRFPGAFPFRPRDAAVARALLEAMAPHALPDPPHVQVVVEENAAVASALRDAGADQRMHLVHMEGPLPPASRRPRAPSRDPLHGVTLEAIVTALVARHGWEALGHLVPVRCFQFDPSVKSSLTFLRRTPWARAKVEELFRRSLPRSRD